MSAVTARSRQKDETRQRLFLAASVLFAQRGYHATSVERIARAAGVAKGTFFVHFATKEAVVVELVRLQVRAARKHREASLATSPSPLSALRATVMALGTEAERSREVSRAVLAAGLANAAVAGDTDALFGEIFEHMKVDAQHAIDCGELRAGLSAETVASTLMASYLGATLHFTSSRNSPPLGPLLERIVSANIAGFTAPETQP